MRGAVHLSCSVRLAAEHSRWAGGGGGGLHSLLGGSWVLICRVLSDLHKDITIATLLTIPRIITHEPPSAGSDMIRRTSRLDGFLVFLVIMVQLSSLGTPVDQMQQTGL